MIAAPPVTCAAACRFERQIGASPATELVHTIASVEF
jgi:hypothetical protein